MAIKTKSEETQLFCKEIKITEIINGTHEVNGERVLNHSLGAVKMHINSVGLDSLQETFFGNIPVNLETLPEELQKKVPAVIQFFTDVAEHEINMKLNGNTENANIETV